MSEAATADQGERLSGDLLIGAAAIAAYLGVKPRQVWHWASTGKIPTFKTGALTCARKSQLNQALSAEMEGR